jgi:hypothetical protein
MTEEIITTKTGTYGRIQVTLPMPVKNVMLEWQRNSGLKKSEFFRMALMKGVGDLAEELRAKDPRDGYYGPMW